MLSVRNVCLVTVTFLASNLIRALELPDISPLPDAEYQSFEWEWSGYLMADADQYKQEDTSTATETNVELRRMRTSLQFSTRHWEGELELRAEGDTDFQDANVTYTGLGFVEVSLGKMKIPSGLENDVSSRHLLMIERSIASEQSSLGRGVGLLVSRSKKRLGFKLGYFENQDWNDIVRDSVFRGYLSPINKKKRQLHIGYHTAVRDWQTGNYRIRSDLAINTLDAIAMSPSLTPKKIHQSGLELAYQQWGMLLQAEYHHQMVHVNRDSAQRNSEYQMFNTQISWLPFGQHRRYRDGVFKRVSGQSGAKKIELVVRHSEVDAFDNNIGALVDSQSIGVNWYVIDNTKFMLNHLASEWQRPANGTRQKWVAWTARLQWEFEL